MSKPTVKVDKHDEGPHDGWNTYFFKYLGHVPIKLLTIEKGHEAPYSYISLVNDDYSRRCDQDTVSGVKWISPCRVDGVLTPQAALDIVAFVIGIVGRAKIVGYNNKALEVRNALATISRTQ